MAAGILLSRVSGLIRSIVIGIALGRGTFVADAFSWTMRIPNLLQNLLGEGALSASFIPVYAKLVEDDKKDEADTLAGGVISLLVLITALLVGLGVFAARPIVSIGTNWETNPEKYELTIDLLRITTMGLGFLVISAWCLGILNSHRSFFSSYVAPVIWNVTQIAVATVALAMGFANTDIVVAIAWAVVVGGIGQVLFQLPKVRRLAPSIRANLSMTESLRDVLRRFVPAVGARGVLQISSFADTVLAGVLVTGALATYAQFVLPLYLLPVSLFGFSVAAAELAEMSRTSDRPDVIAGRLQPALRRVLIPAGLVTAAYVGASTVFVDALYGVPSRLLDRGLTEKNDIAIVGLVLSTFALGLPAAMTARVTQNTLYSLGDVKGPARIAALRLIVSVIISAIMMLQLDWLFFNDEASIEAFGDVPHWPPWELLPKARRETEGLAHLGATGLAIGATAGSWLEWALLKRRLQATIGGSISSGVGARVGVAGIAAMVSMFFVARLTADVPSPLDAILVGVVGVAMYLAFFYREVVDRSLFTG